MALTILQIVAVILVATAMGLSLAHALEYPGKRRLNEVVYKSVQSMYYPGFTIGGGIGEFGGIVFTALLLFLTPPRSADFWLTFVALLALLGMQAVYWLVTHPVNRLWVEGEKMSGAGKFFFKFAASHAGGQPANWTLLRDRWECSHLVRAVLAFAGFVALVAALSEIS